MRIDVIFGEGVENHRRGAQVLPEKLEFTMESLQFLFPIGVRQALDNCQFSMADSRIGPFYF